MAGWHGKHHHESHGATPLKLMLQWPQQQPQQQPQQARHSQSWAPEM